MSLDQVFKDFENSLKDISNSLQNQSLSQSQANHALLNLQQQLSIQKSIIDSNINQVSKQAKEVLSDIQSLASSLIPNIKKLEDIPIVKHPKWFCVDIEFPAIYTDKVELTEVFASQRSLSSYINVNPEGPFVITQMMPLVEIGKGHGYLGDSTSEMGGFANPWLSDPTALIPPFANLTSSPIGRTVPCTAFSNIINNLGITNNTSFGWNTPSLTQLCNEEVSNAAVVFYQSRSWGPLADLPEFEFQIEIGGSGRFWTNQYIPAAAFYGTSGQPYYMGAYGWVDRADRLIVHARNLKEVNYDCTVKMIFHGYQMLGHVDIAKALGY